MSTKLLAFFIIVLACVTVNAQSQLNNQNKFIGQAFDEIVVSSDLNVRRKSKENRQGKRLLTNVPSGTPTTTSSPPSKSTALASRLVLSDGSSITSDRRRKRMAQRADPSWLLTESEQKRSNEYSLRRQRPWKKLAR